MGTFASVAKSALEVTVDGEPVEFSPLTFGDFGAFERYAQYLPYQSIKDCDVSDEDKLTVLHHCIKHPVTWNGTTGQQMLANISGMVEMLYLSAKHKHPTVTRDVFKDIPFDKIQQLCDSVAAISGLDDNPSKKKKR